ncbi:MAG: hypothetical protein K8S20_16925 [Chloroflexi bacterium]|nr:hypothetical protein [Chloroflexota bacterium]
MKKLFTILFLAAALTVMTVGTAFAQTATPITGTVQSVVVETDATTGISTVLVTITDDAGATQTLRLDTATAETLGLVTNTSTTDPVTGATQTETVVNDGAVGTAVTIDPATVIADPATETDQHPVGSKLSEFFSGLLGVDYDTIMTYHEDGVGFGVIAQALWLTNDIGGDTAAFEALLDAKKSGDYSAITLADGSTPDNWGDVVKSLKKGDNLGSVMSGKADQTVDGSSETTVKEHGKGNGGNNQGHGKSSDHGRP